MKHRSLIAITIASSWLLATTSWGARGGPDAGGWSWADSTEPGVDDLVETPTGLTTLVNPWPDEAVVAVPLSIPFTFYGVTSSTVWVSSNGWLSFVDPLGSPAPLNRPIPSAGAPNAVLAYHWDDLGPGAPSFLQHGPTPNGHQLVIRQIHAPSGELVQVNIQFYRNGAIKVRVVAVADVTKVTIGIENEFGTVGHQLAFDGAMAPGFAVNPTMAILFYPDSGLRCTAATPVACGDVVATSTIGGSRAISRYPCSARTYTGNERVYQLTTTSMMLLNATLTGLGARDLDLFVYRPGCDGVIDCIAGGVKVLGPTLLAAGVHYLVVDGVTPADDGPFTLTVGCAASTTPLACGGAVTDTLGGTGSIDDYDCLGVRGGPERIYTFSTTTAQTVVARLVPPGPFDLILADQADLSPGSTPCFDAADSDLGVLSLPPGDWSLIVDGMVGATGSYDLTLDCTTLPAIPINCGDVDVRGTSALPSLIDRWRCGGGPLPGYTQGEVFYRFLPPPYTIATFTVTDPTEFDLFVSRESDLSRTCLGTGDATLTLGNLDPVDHIIALDSATVSGANGLSVDCTAFTPTVITCDRTIPATTGSTDSFDGYQCRPAPLDGGEAWFVFDNPIPQTFAVAVSGAPAPADLDVVVYAAPFTTATACTGFGDDVAVVAGAPAGPYLIVVDGRAGATDVPFDLTVACGGPTLSCAGLPNLACGDDLIGDTTSGTAASAIYGTVGLLFTGREDVYHFSTSVTQPVVFQLAGATDPRLDLILLDGCDLTSVLAYDDEAIVLSALPPGDYYLVVDGRAGTSGPYQLRVSCSSFDCTGAVDLSCNSYRAGDTALGSATAWQYGALTPLYTGREVAYHFTNPVAQPVAFVLANESDPRLDLFLLDACDTLALRQWGDGAISAPVLPAGDYYVVADGREDIDATYELATICGRASLDPPVLTTTLDPGACFTETKRLYFPRTAPAGDLMLSFDLSGSMGPSVDQMKAGARRLYTQLLQLLPSLRIGLASFVEYELPYIDTVCGVDHFPTATDPYAFKLHLPPTADIDLLDAVLGSIEIVGGGKETYTRSLQEAHANPGIGWRSCARKFWLSFGDEVPVDCNVDACIGGSRNTGRDPGPDLTTGTADDAILLNEIDAMAALGIRLIAVDSSETPALVSLWDCLAARTGGGVVETDLDGIPLGGLDLVDAVIDEVLTGVSLCPELRLTAEGPWAPWVTVTPAIVTNVTTPYSGEFTVTFCVPPGTPAGSYDLTVAAECLADVDCAEPLATQAISIEVPSRCVPGPAAAAPPPAAICAGETALLDGSPSTDCGAGLQYRWLDGPTAVCDWSASPTCAVTPPTSRSYRLEVACVDDLTCVAATTVWVAIVAAPIAAAGDDIEVCEGVALRLDAAASSGASCPGGLSFEWYDGATVVRPWSADPTFVPPTTTAGVTTYTVIARCALPPACEGADAVVVTVKSCPLSVRFDRYGVTRLVHDGRAGFEVSWRTLSEEGTVGFAVERAANFSGPYATVEVVAAVGPRHEYRLFDDGATAIARPWYRIVELTVDGVGDATPPFQFTAAPSGADRSRVRTRGSQPDPRRRGDGRR